MYWRDCLNIIAVAFLIAIVISSACIIPDPYRPTDEVKGAFNTKPISDSLVIRSILNTVRRDKSERLLDPVKERVQIFDGDSLYYVSIRSQDFHLDSSGIKQGKGRILVLSKDSLRVLRKFPERW